MVLVKAFIYFIVLKAGTEFLYREGMSLVGAAVAAVSIAGIEFMAAAFMAAAIGAYMARARFASAKASDLLLATLPVYLVSTALGIGAALVVIFAFSRDLWQREFSRGYPSKYFWDATITLALIVAGMTMVGYLAMIWAVNRQARGVDG